VLDIGCGTGALTVRAARRGAFVKGIDVNPEMLAIARARVQDDHLEENVELVAKGVAELDAEKTETYDAVMSGLCFSELSDDERAYTLGQVARVLKRGGVLLVADEVRPRSVPTRLLYSIVRAPLAALTYVIAQQTTHALREFPKSLADAGLSLISVETSMLGSFGVFVAQRPGRARS